jgi:hypothetical protein
MKMNDVRKIAKTMKINSKNMKKVDLIRAIQEAEGNCVCYQTERADCDQLCCAWRGDCLNGRGRKAG